jgi:hypothetical protein
MYEADDPRSRLSTAGGATGQPAAGFGRSTYARFYAEPPQEQGEGHRTWYTRGQNFVVCYSEAQAGAVLERRGQPDEYVLLLPEAETSVLVEANGEMRDIAGFTITMIPAGESRITVTAGGPVVRLISTRSPDISARASNAGTYAGPHPHVPAFEPWPEPPDGPRIRSYSLDVADEPGRFGKIFRCTTFMVNVFPPQLGPRDPARLSPHQHDDFEQCSLAVGGVYEHHLRWPWVADKAQWREDEHERCASPSVCVIPPRVIHTSAAVDPGINLLVDIFAPPRADFSDMPGWVLNAADYPR